MRSPVKLTLSDKLKMWRLWKKITTDKAMLEKLKSRKFLVAIVGAVIIATGDYLGVDSSIATKIAALFATYILSEGAVDAARALPVKEEKP